MNKIPDSETRLEILAAIHESAVDAIIAIDERGIVETINPATQKLFGYSSTELVGQNISILMPQPFRSEHDGYLHKYQNTGIAHIIGVGRQITAIKKDGTVFPIHLTVTDVKLSDRRVFAGFIRDLSELKQVEEQRATLGQIIEESLNEIYVFDADTLQFIQVNRGGRENLGFSLQELLTMTPLDIKPQYSRAEFRAMLHPLTSGEKNHLSFRSQHRRRDGSTYDIDIYLQLAIYQTQTVFVAIALDISERLAAERLVAEQQEQMNSALEKLVEIRTEELHRAQTELVRSENFSTLGKVSGGIAHEIRNPLNAVKTSAYFLLNAADPSPEKVREHLERIDRQVTLIDNVITALADIAKLPQARLRPVNMRVVLDHVVRLANLPPSIQFQFDLPEALPEVLADEHQIAIAFRNLVRNARDAMPSGGSLRIQAAIGENTVDFAVIDTGEGIAPENLQRILEPLFTTKVHGMGLGLSITQTIIEKNLGTLSVSSQLGEGSQFQVTLNIAKADG